MSDNGGRVSETPETDAIHFNAGMSTLDRAVAFYMLCRKLESELADCQRKLVEAEKEAGCVVWTDGVAALPDCMMPDGGDPCIGFQQVRDERDEYEKRANKLESELADYQRSVKNLIKDADELAAAYLEAREQVDAAEAKLAEMEKERDDWKRDRYQQLGRAEIEQIYKEKAKAKLARIAAAEKPEEPKRFPVNWPGLNESVMWAEGYDTLSAFVDQLQQIAKGEGWD